MSFLDEAGGFFFGEDPKLDIDSRTTLSGGQNKALEDFLLPFLTGQSLDSFKGTPFEGDRVADLSDIEQLLLDKTGSAISGASDQFQGLREAIEPALAGNVGDFEEFFQKTVAEPGIQQFERDILPLINRQFAGSGFHGSERREDRLRATDDLNTALTRSRADIGFQTRESALDRVLKAAQIGGGLPGQEASFLQQLQPITQTERGIEQARLDTDFEEFIRLEQEAKSERDKRIQQILQALNVQSVENIGAGLPGSSGFISDFFAGGGGSGLMGLF